MHPYDLIVWLKNIEEDEIVDSRRCVDQLIKSQLLAKSREKTCEIIKFDHQESRKSRKGSKSQRLRFWNIF